MEFSKALVKLKAGKKVYNTNWVSDRYCIQIQKSDESNKFTDPYFAYILKSEDVTTAKKKGMHFFGANEILSNKWELV